jgi:hypothetical protein
MTENMTNEESYNLYKLFQHPDDMAWTKPSRAELHLDDILHHNAEAPDWLILGLVKDIIGGAK